MSLRNSVGVLVLTLLTILPCRAQVSTAQITGAVNDPTGAAIPGAVVEAANVDTGAMFRGETNDSGYYTLTPLPPGRYRVEVRSEGFRTVSQSGISLAVAQVARLDFNLEVGAVSERIEVTADAPLLESQTASLGQVVETRTTRFRPGSSASQLRPGVAASYQRADSTFSASSGDKPSSRRRASLWSRSSSCRTSQLRIAVGSLARRRALAAGKLPATTPVKVPPMPARPTMRQSLKVWTVAALSMPTREATMAAAPAPATP